MKNPIQPFKKDEHGTLRFKGNAIVQHLLDTHQSCDMSELAKMDFTDDDRQQFAQLIGYSLDGYGMLSYVDDNAYYAAQHLAENPEMTDAEARIAASKTALIHQLEEALEELRSQSS